MERKIVLVDTSVWISLFRQDNEMVGQKMWELVVDNHAALCGQIWVEYLGGFRKTTERVKHEKALRQFPFIDTPREAYEKAAELLALQPRLKAGDAIIAATALTAKISLFTLDQDFKPLRSEGLKFI